MGAIAVNRADETSQVLDVRSGELCWTAPEGDWEIWLVDHQFRTSVTRAVNNVDHIVVTAANLSITLQPGEYWVNITPYGGSGGFGPEILLSVMTPAGDPSASFDPMGAFGPPSTWFDMGGGADGAMVIHGEITVSNDGQSWGSVKSLYQN